MSIFSFALSKNLILSKLLTLYLFFSYVRHVQSINKSCWFFQIFSVASYFLLSPLLHPHPSHHYPLLGILKYIPELLYILFFIIQPVITMQCESEQSSGIIRTFHGFPSHSEWNPKPLQRTFKDLCDLNPAPLSHPGLISCISIWLNCFNQTGIQAIPQICPENRSLCGLYHCVPFSLRLFFKFSPRRKKSYFLLLTSVDNISAHLIRVKVQICIETERWEGKKLNKSSKFRKTKHTEWF